MKPSIKLAVLAVVILCCVHGEVASKNRGKCVKKKEEPEPHKIFVTITGLCLWRTVECRTKEEERFGRFPYQQSEASALKAVGISRNKIKARFNLSKKSFFICLTH